MNIKLADYRILANIEELATKYGVADIVTSLSDKKVTIYYNRLGEGSALSQMISEMMAEFAPDVDHNIKMTPSDLKLEITLT